MSDLTQDPISGVGAFIIGDEIILGTRQDKHLATLIDMLAKRGMTLDWATYLGDNRPRMIDAMARSFATDDLVFCFGGIGVTPDDHTRQAAAAALGRELVLQPQAEIEIRARMAEVNYPVTPERLELGHFPLGAQIIPNPYNRIPGFSVRHHHFLPGFPQMAWPMAEWVLDTQYAACFHVKQSADAAILVWEGLEGTLLGLMKRIETEFDGLKVFSLPFLGSDTLPRHIELGVRGAPEQVPAAMTLMRQEVTALGYQFQDKAK